VHNTSVGAAFFLAVKQGSFASYTLPIRPAEEDRYFSLQDGNGVTGGKGPLLYNDNPLSTVSKGIKHFVQKQNSPMQKYLEEVSQVEKMVDIYRVIFNNNTIFKFLLYLG